MRTVVINLLLLCAMAAQAQSFVLQGRVVDEQLNPVELATVSCLQQGKTIVASLKGKFSMQLMSADSVVIRFSVIGYETRQRVLRHPRGKQTSQIVLNSDDQMLGEVKVMGEKIQTGQTQNLETEHVKTSPSVTGNDVEELMQSQASVFLHNELSSQYNVGGGASDENSVCINNIEIYRSFLVRSGQQEGLSVINPDMVEKIGFSTGGFEAKYGDKISSALDIAYRRPKPSEASMSASLLGAGAFVGFRTKTVVWSNGLRCKTNKCLLRSLETEGEYKPDFSDYQTYLVYTPNKRWKLSFIGNLSDNHYVFTPEDGETAFGILQNVESFEVYFDGHEKDRFNTYFGSIDLTHNFGDSASMLLLASALSTSEREKYGIQGQYQLTQTETGESLGVGTYFQHARNYLKAHVENVKLTAKHISK